MSNVDMYIHGLSIASDLLNKPFIVDCLDFFDKDGIIDLTEDELKWYFTEVYYCYEKDMKKIVNEYKSKELYYNWKDYNKEKLFKRAKEFLEHVKDGALCKA